MKICQKRLQIQIHLKSITTGKEIKQYSNALEEE